MVLEKNIETTLLLVGFEVVENRLRSWGAWEVSTVF